ENLAEHRGNFRNPTKGPLMNRTLSVLNVIQLATSALASYTEMQKTGIGVGWAVPFNPNGLYINDPSKASKTLEGQAITVYGPRGSSTDYVVHDGNYYPSGSDKPVDPNMLKGQRFELR